MKAAGFVNCYQDTERAEAYSKLEFARTYYLAYRDLPEIFRAHVQGRAAIDFGCGAGRSTRFLRQCGFDAVHVLHDDVADDEVGLQRACALHRCCSAVNGGGVVPVQVEDPGQSVSDNLLVIHHQNSRFSTRVHACAPFKTAKPND